MIRQHAGSSGEYCSSEPFDLMIGTIAAKLQATLPAADANHSLPAVLVSTNSAAAKGAAHNINHMNSNVCTADPEHKQQVWSQQMDAMQLSQDDQCFAAHQQITRSAHQGSLWASYKG